MKMNGLYLKYYCTVLMPHWSHSRQNSAESQVLPVTANKKGVFESNRWDTYVLLSFIQTFISVAVLSSILISHAIPGLHFKGNGNVKAGCCGGSGDGGDNSLSSSSASSFTTSLLSSLISMICVDVSRSGVVAFAFALALAFSRESSEKSSSDVIKLWRLSKFDKLTVCCNGLKSSENWKQ